MKCQQCRQVNPEDANYCVACGTHLEQACPNCQSTAPSGAAFCPHCGARLADASPGTQEPARAPAPPRLAKDPDGERRHATVLFSDLSGYTTLGERLDPEEVFQLTNRIMREAEQIVARHGGTANQFRGDEIMALFGIPTAHEDDPERAVRAAHELHAMVRRISAEVEEQIGLPLRMHSGINTGLMVSYQSDGRRGRYDLTGDTVNTAARLTSVARTDEIVVSPTTYKRLDGVFRCEPMEPVSMKNKAKPMTPYRVLGAAGLRSRVAVAQKRQMTIFSGRERELSRLKECLERALAGQGQFVSIIGERGMGKSRLVYEFRQQIDRRWVDLTHLRCEPGTDQVSYAPFVRLLRRMMRIRPDSEPAEAAARLADAVRANYPALERYLPYYGRLLGIKDDTIAVGDDTDSAGMQQAFDEAIAALLIDRAARGLQLLLIEDVEHADESSRGLLRYLAESVPAYAIMVVATAPPAVAKQSPIPDSQTQLKLEPLSREQTAQTAAACCGAEEAEPELVSQVYHHTNGNPYFIEQLCKSLCEDGSLVVDNGRVRRARPGKLLAMPDSIRAVARERSDRLDPATREVVQHASVLGREFSRSVLEQVHGDRTVVRAALEQLKAESLIRQVRLVPDATYMFIEGLFPSVIYDTLLLRERREIHARAARALEEFHRNDLESMSAALAEHYAQSLRWQEAVHHGWRAARREYDLARFDQALNGLEQVTRWLNQLPPTREREEQQLDLGIQRAYVLLKMGRLEEGEQCCRDARRTAEALDDPERLGQAVRTHGVLHLFRGDQAMARECFEDALAHLQRADNHNSLTAYLALVLGVSYNQEGRWAEAARHLDEAVHIMEVKGLTAEYFEGSITLPYVTGCVHLGYNQAVQGKPQDAPRLFQRAHTAIEAGNANLLSRAAACVWEARFASLIGRERPRQWERAEDVVARTEAASAPLLESMARYAMAVLCRVRGQQSDAYGHARRCVDLMGDDTSHRILGHAHYELALAAIELGQLEEADQACQATRRHCRDAPAWLEPRYAYLRARLAFARGPKELATGRKWMERSIAGDEEAGAWLLADRTRVEYGQLLSELGWREEAEEVMATVRERSQEADLLAWLEPEGAALKPGGAE